MIAYFDTSAVVPLLIEEPWSERAGRVWDVATRVVSARLVYPEARAALALAQRLGRLSASQLRAAVEGLEGLDRQLDHVEITEGLATRAGDLAEAVGLRGYDAVHLAAAESLADEDLVVVAADGPLRSAAAELGMATAPLDP
jgi:predicted nucleic acid-binding protein